LIILLVVAALWTLVAGLEPLATWAATHVSPQQERQLGEQSFKNMVAPSSLRDNGESARVLRAIGRRITEGSRYQYEFHVVDNPDVNAFALPGGIVVVNTGLIGATKRPEELAGVIAHEVQHVELQHGLRQIAKQFGFAACLSLIAGNLDSNLGGKIAAELVSLKFSRSAEQQADERAIAKLAQVGIDPNALPQFFRRLAAETAAPEWLSSHPATTDRQQKLEALIRAHAVVRSVPLEYGPWPPSSIR
jgi:predicted Zn-dependent protease